MRSGYPVTMRIARFNHDDVVSYAFVQKDDNDGKDYLVELDGYPLGAQPVSPTGQRFAADGDGIRLLSPVIPSKVYGLAKNYKDPSANIAGSDASGQFPVIFTKPATSVIGPDDPIVLPAFSRRMNYEPELAVVIGRIAKNISAADAMSYVLGYTCVNDATLLDIQAEDPTWTRAKGFDASCPLGPWIETDINYADAHISFRLNGKEIPEAEGTTANLVCPIPEQIAEISRFSTLLPGDVIMTGTPYAAGTVKPGDETVVTVEGIGSLRNIVVQGD